MEKENKKNWERLGHPPTGVKYNWISGQIELVPVKLANVVQLPIQEEPPVA